MRISDWSSDVCSSDLERLAIANRGHAAAGERLLPLRHLDQAVCRRAVKQRAGEFLARRAWGFLRHLIECYDGAARGKGKRGRKSVVWGKCVSGRVAFGGRRISKKKNK